MKGKTLETSTDTFADKPQESPGRPVREHMIAVHEWFTSLSPERREAFRQKVRDANAED